MDRVNLKPKYFYIKKTHFLDCIKQYQGKQNFIIPPYVYRDLEDQFERHHLLVGDKNTPKEIRFQKLAKLHIMTFLKDPLKYTKHYGDAHLIHYEFTGKRPADIFHLEKLLLDDFDVLIKKYHGMKIKRKKFISVHYVLYQLLRRHNFPCKNMVFQNYVNKTERSTRKKSVENYLKT